MESPKRSRPTLEEIRKARVELEADLEDARRQVRDTQAALKALHGECEHPNKFQYSATGELGWKCPDCGWST